MPAIPISDHKSLRIRRSALYFLLALLLVMLTTAQAQPGTDIASLNQLPTIGDPADRFLSPAQEVTLGADFLRNIYRSNAVLQDPEISDYIQHLGDVLVSSLGSGEFRYTFFVVNDASINAFAVPGGYIGVNAGLILASNNESELAGVIAHEIAHVAQRHIARRIADISANQIPTLGAVLAGILLAAGGGSGDASQALLFAGIAAQQQQILNFTRSNEIEADRIGLKILYQAGFDPNGMAGFFKNLQRQRFGRIPEQFEYLLTHPLDNTRISEAQARINQLPRQTHQSSSYYHLLKARLQALIHKEPVRLIEQLQKDNSIKPDYSDIDKFAYSQALERNGHYKEAAKILHRLVEKNEENVSYQLAYARSMSQIGNKKKSADTLSKMLAIYPDDFSVNYYYAKLLNDMGKPKQGRDTLKSYLRKNPAPNLNVYKLLAELHENSGDKIDSKQILAEYYFNSGNYNAAIFQLRQALQNPQVTFVKRSQIENRLRQILTATRS